MAAQTVQETQDSSENQESSEKDIEIETIEIPDRFPEEIFENDSILTLESNLNKIEDKMEVTVKSVLDMANELKIQIHEIERLESTIAGMHEFIVTQNDKIFKLQDRVDLLDNSNINNNKKVGFWSRIFSK